MSDKLYSRKIIHIPKFEFKKVNRFKVILYLIFIISFILIGYYLYIAFPIFKSSCESAAGSLAIHITNESVMEVMQNYTYEDFMKVQKTDSGKINLVEANIVTINQAISKIVSEIQKKIDKAPRTNVFINMGSISGISNLKIIGAQFDIELETAGRIYSDLQTEFEAVGINQTLHKIFVKLNTDIGILTPYGNFKRNFETTVLLTQAIIIGDIPETYYDFNGSYTNEEDVAMEAM